MSASSSPKMPPVRLVRALEGVRARLLKLHRRMVPGPMALLELTQSSMITQAIYVAADLKVADALHSGPQTAEELAKKVDADPDALHRLMRLLASYDIFAEQNDGRFTMTSMGDALRSDSPNSMRPIALLMGHPTHWEEWGHFAYSVRSGQPTIPKTRGMGAYEYLEKNPEYAEIFMGGMGNLSNLETLPILAAYDFSRYQTVVDVYGGRGALLAGALQRSPQSRGILFDGRAGELGAKEFLQESGVADRCEIEGGDLFGPYVKGGDAYILKHIVHDWPEPQVIEILKNVREAINPDGRLLLMEFVAPEKGNRQHPAKLIDLWLMLLVGGKERSASQYSEVFAKTGFRLERVVQTASPVCIVEASPC
ncbi:methyltransferase [Wenjunlia vitaminophila]|nr:methyltransferase [Wenjunlia vitaminophila]